MGPKVNDPEGCETGQPCKEGGLTNLERVGLDLGSGGPAVAVAEEEASCRFRFFIRSRVAAGEKLGVWHSSLQQLITLSSLLATIGGSRYGSYGKAKLTAPFIFND